ncbi:MAG: hypothetical protein PVH46_04665 [Granulosicoccaceae bacterium]|jgi:hypothetical protein
MFRRGIGIGIVLAALFVVGQARASDYGYIEKDGVRMPIRDIHALHDKKNGNIKIYLFPSRLGAQEKQALRNKDAFFVLVDKPSPDTRKWQWYPYAMLRLDSKNGKFASIDELKGYYLLAYGIQKKNATDNINEYGAFRKQLSSYALRGSRLQFSLAGQADYFKLSWKLDISGRLQPH